MAALVSVLSHVLSMVNERRETGFGLPSGQGNASQAVKLPAHHGAVAPFGPPCAIQALAPLEGCSPRKAFLEKGGVFSKENWRSEGLRAPASTTESWKSCSTMLRFGNPARMLLRKQAGQRGPSTEHRGRSAIVLNGWLLRSLGSARARIAGRRSGPRWCLTLPGTPHGFGDCVGVGKTDRWRWQGGDLEVMNTATGVL